MVSYPYPWSGKTLFGAVQIRYSNAVTVIPAFVSIDPGSRRVSLNSRDPAFYGDPNAVYAALHVHCPTFYWEEQKQWFFTGYDHVNSLLRDRRFGRQILHLASREELGLPPTAATSPAFRCG